jgi:uncharacterized membrane protein YgcG
MNFARTLASLSASLVLAACATYPPQGPSILALPGKDKSLAAFQQDLSICQQHAVSHTGFGGPSEPVAQPPAGSAVGNTAIGATPAGPGAGTSKTAAPAGAKSPDEISYAQCMAARGDIVQTAPGPFYDDGYAYDNGYAYAYPYSGVYPYAYPYGFGFGYGYPYAYPYFGAGFVGGGLGYFAFNARHGGFHSGFHGNRFHGGGFHGGFHGWGSHGGSTGGGSHGGGGSHH